MKIFFYITAIFTLVSCNNGEIEKLKKENELIREQSKITKSDSISIFNSILKNSNRKFRKMYICTRTHKRQKLNKNSEYILVSLWGRSFL